MRNFIKDYLQDPSQAVMSLENQTDSWSEHIDEDAVYAAISTPEFRLYEEMIFCDIAEDLRIEESIRPVA